MFTGIIEELGRVLKVRRQAAYVRLQIGANKVLRELQPGASIAVNGVCQTVEKCDSESFTVAAFAETLAKSNLGSLAEAASRPQAVHLERALSAAARLDGHLVQGHVDGVARLRALRHVRENHYLRLELPAALLDLCVLHGSICVDGVSLTIAQLYADGVEVNIIEHTWRHTLFGQYARGALLNVECDVLGKYLLRFAQRGLLGNCSPKPAGQQLQEHGTNAANDGAAQRHKDKKLQDLLRDW